MHYAVLPSLEGHFLLDDLEGAKMISITRFWPRDQIARNVAPISYSEAMAILHDMRHFNIWSIAPILIESDMSQDEINHRLANLKRDERYISWRISQSDDKSEDAIELIRNQIREPLSGYALEVFNQMEKSALENPFAPPIPIL